MLRKSYYHMHEKTKIVRLHLHTEVATQRLYVNINEDLQKKKCYIINDTYNNNISQLIKKDRRHIDTKSNETKLLKKKKKRQTFFFY